MYEIALIQFSYDLPNVLIDGNFMNYLIMCLDKPLVH